MVDLIVGARQIFGIDSHFTAYQPGGVSLIVTATLYGSPLHVSPNSMTVTAAKPPKIT